MPKLKKSPLAPKRFPKLPDVAGVQLAAVAAGESYRGRDDVMLTRLPAGTTVAGVFTQSSFPGAPVDWCRRQIGRGRARALLVNAGNANVFTGRAGAQAVADGTAAVADLVGCRARDVFVASTGVIGEKLAFQRIRKAIGRAGKLLGRSDWQAAARAIMTTDTYPKGSGRIARIGETDVRIAGIAKGSGMIAPDMATMLAFVFTDAKIPADVLQRLLTDINRRSFNAITVDSDTSTSDTVLLFATGQAGRHPAVRGPRDRHFADFRAKLEEVMTDLAQQIVRDGEGAGKFIEVRVSGSASAKAAHDIGKSIANSPLVKTAIAGEDANWGRIVMAIGKSGQRADRDRLAIRIGGVQVAENGYVSSGYREQDVVPHMRGQEIEIDVDVGVGSGKATIWTCDLTHGYIDINADYRS